MDEWLTLERPVVCCRASGCLGRGLDGEVLELANILVNQPEAPGPQTVMHGGRASMNELPVCEVIDHFAWRVVAEEWSGRMPMRPINR